MRLALATFATLAATTVLAPTAPAEEVEHPAYRSWARHKPGTSISLRSRNICAESTLTTTTTYTLIEVREDRVVLETRRVSDATGRTSEGPPDRTEQKRLFPLFPGVKKEDVGNPIDATAKGEETLKLVGREIKATWYDTKGRLEAGETQTRMWLSDDVPGRLVKSVVKVPKANTTITLELVKFETP